jgi:hypothetical protein
VSDRFDQTIRAALDILEDQVLVDIGLSPDDVPYDAIAITAQGTETIETTGGVRR